MTHQRLTTITYIGVEKVKLVLLLLTYLRKGTFMNNVILSSFWLRREGLKFDK